MAPPADAANDVLRRRHRAAGTSPLNKEKRKGTFAARAATAAVLVGHNTKAAPLAELRQPRPMRSDHDRHFS